MRITSSIVRDLGLRAAVEMQSRAVAGAERVADTKRVQAAIIAPVAFLAMTGTAVAAECGDTDATGKLTGLISAAAKFMMAIGGALALLTFVIGGILIMVGGTSERVAKGKKLVTNTIIGLAIMAGGFFLKVVILSFVSGGTGGSNGSACIKNGDGNFGG